MWRGTVWSGAEQSETELRRRASRAKQGGVQKRAQHGEGEERRGEESKDKGKERGEERRYVARDM